MDADTRLSRTEQFFEALRVLRISWIVAVMAVFALATPPQVLDLYRTLADNLHASQGLVVAWVHIVITALMLVVTAFLIHYAGRHRALVYFSRRPDVGARTRLLPAVGTSRLRSARARRGGCGHVRRQARSPGHSRRDRPGYRSLPCGHDDQRQLPGRSGRHSPVLRRAVCDCCAHVGFAVERDCPGLAATVCFQPTPAPCRLCSGDWHDRHGIFCRPVRAPVPMARLSCHLLGIHVRPDRDPEPLADLVRPAGHSVDPGAGHMVSGLVRLRPEQTPGHLGRPAQDHGRSSPEFLCRLVQRARRQKCVRRRAVSGVPGLGRGRRPLRRAVRGQSSGAPSGPLPGLLAARLCHQRRIRRQPRRRRVLEPRQAACDERRMASVPRAGRASQPMRFASRTPPKRSSSRISWRRLLRADFLPTWSSISSPHSCRNSRPSCFPKSGATVCRASNTPRHS